MKMPTLNNGSEEVDGMKLPDRCPSCGTVLAGCEMNCPTCGEYLGFDNIYPPPEKGAEDE
jgi:hypothetical protein